jgi:hypothetical protein
MLKASLFNPIIQRRIVHVQENKNTIYNDAQNVHISSIQQSIKNSINNFVSLTNLFRLV